MPIMFIAAFNGGCIGRMDKQSISQALGVGGGMSCVCVQTTKQTSRCVIICRILPPQVK